jgi:hypothetical protein
MRRALTRGVCAVREQVLERVGVQGHGMATALSACIPASKVRISKPLLSPLMCCIVCRQPNTYQSGAMENVQGEAAGDVLH